MEDFSKLLGKKPKTEMSEEETQAKMEVIMELLDQAKSMMADQVKGGMDEMFAPKSVEVMAPDQESLEEGLDVAQDMVSDEPSMESEESDEDSEDDKEEGSDDEMSPFPKKKKPLFDLV